MKRKPTPLPPGWSRTVTAEKSAATVHKAEPVSTGISASDQEKIDNVVAYLSNVSGVKADSILKRRKAGRPSKADKDTVTIRQVAMFGARQNGVSGKAVAKHFGISKCNLSTTYRRLKQVVDPDGNLVNLLQALV